MKMYHLVEAESLWALSQRGAVNLPQVKELQDKLRAAGHDPGASDGWYGQKTANAVRAYQEANGLKVDGDAGPQTLAKLGMAGAQQTKAVATPPEKTAAKPAPRKTSTEPKTVAPVSTTKSKQTTKANNASNITPIDIGNATSGRTVRSAVNSIGSNSNPSFQFSDWQDVRKYNGGAILTVKTNASRAEANNIADILQDKLKGSADMALSIVDMSGTALANSKLYLEPLSSSTSSKTNTKAKTSASKKSTSSKTDINWSSYAKKFRETITDDFKDPSSAKFTKVSIRQITGKPSNPKIVIPDYYYIVGYVNGKNSYGAYIGAKPFYGTIFTGPTTSGGNYAMIAMPTIYGGKDYEKIYFEKIIKDIMSNSTKVADIKL